MNRITATVARLIAILLVITVFASVASACASGTQHAVRSHCMSQTVNGTHRTQCESYRNGHAVYTFTTTR